MVSIKYLLEKRRGAGGRGGGGSIGGGSSSGGSSRGGSSSGGSSSGSNRGGSPPPPYSSVGGSSSGYSRSGSYGSQSTLSSGPSSFGSRSTFPIPASQPFAGRLVGGGVRSGIYSRGGYGSGLPLVAGGAIGAGIGYYGVSGVGFPYGYWPLYYHPHYYGNDEYGRYANSSRPGGVLVSSSFSPPSLTSSNPPQYMVYGDVDSVSNVTEALTTDCSATIVVGSTPIQENGEYDSSVNMTLLPSISPENYLSFYRGSSFALYAFFDNNANDSQRLVNYTEPEPTSPVFYYPGDQRNQSFESCVNDTINTWLPIQEAASATAGSTSGSSQLELRARTGGLAALVGILLLSGMRWQSLVMLFAFLSLIFLQ
ncbi:uncharacterized protein JCM6883_004509 [Sporobolomyces salmoneus]|uniref:uncharacterized protein n=1 Tax=Sporobolomyces salmoneus TaxID=183962 RepID=UPI00317AABA2